MGLFSKSARDKAYEKFMDGYWDADGYKVISGTPQEVQNQMNELHKLYEPTELACEKDNILTIIMKKTGQRSWLTYFYTKVWPDDKKE